MNKLGAGLGLAAVLIGVAVVGTGYVVGGKIEQQIQQSSSSWSRQGMHIQLVSYERGILHSRAETLWTLEGSPSRRDLEAVEDGQIDKPVHGGPILLKAIHQITHGPWPAGRAAQIQTQFFLQSGSSPELRAALKDQPALNWDIQVNWNHSSNHTANAPALSWQQTGTAVQWGGMQADWTMPAQMQSLQGMARFPSLQLTSGTPEEIKVEDTVLRFDLQRTPDHLWLTGPLEISLAKLSQTSAGQPTELQGLRLKTQTDLADQVAQIQLNFQLASLQARGHSANDLALDLGLRNIDAHWLDQWIQGQDSDIDADQDEDAEGSEQLVQDLGLLLAGKPELQLQRLSLRTPQGVTELKANLAFVGDPERTLNPLEDLVTSLEARLPKALLQDLLAQKLQTSLLAEMQDPAEQAEALSAAQLDAQALIDQLIAQGVLQAQQDQLSAQFALGGGRFELNHQALDAQAAAQLIANFFQ